MSEYLEITNIYTNIVLYIKTIYMESDEYFVYGVTVDGNLVQKYDCNYNIFIFDGRKILTEDMMLRFISTYELAEEEVISRFDGTNGINGYVVGDVVFK